MEISNHEKLTLLRKHMKNHNIDAFVAMSVDPHMSEYLPDYWKIRQWLTGFTGSVGTIVITPDFAGLWVDGRYWTQAEHQLQNTGFVLQKLTSDEKSTHLAWLSNDLKLQSKISINTQIVSIQQFELLKQLAHKHDLNIIKDIDLISDIWLDRPTLPNASIYEMREGINALSRQEKISKVLKTLEDKKLDAHFISSVDDIAWILNCRGSDVEYNPIFLSHLYLSKDQKILFIDAQKIPQELFDKLQNENIEILDYNATAIFLSQIQDKKILLDPSKMSYFHKKILIQNNIIEEDINPSTLLKSQKYPSEIEHIRNVMIKDGVALCHFFHWLENAVANNQKITELTIDEKITAFRAQQDGFMGLSFSTIAGFNENGALPHYKATPEKFSNIQGDGLLLIDSGGQYENGTTDITRVVPVGHINAEHKRDYTLVLKCHIALAQAVFPEGLSAPLLDAIARQPLWQQQLDYRHGTGHGVGFSLNVHEGPQVLSYYTPIHTYSKLRKGMIISNEPGIYHEGKYGIRIENLVVTQLIENNSTNYGQFLKFETLTLCPINLDCVEKSLLTDCEINWLNSYHQMVYTRLAPHLSGEVLTWLKEQTSDL